MLEKGGVNAWAEDANGKKEGPCYKDKRATGEQFKAPYGKAPGLNSGGSQ